MYDFFQNNLDVVFFIYGLSFVVMGVAILAQPKQRSEFKLANIIWLLAVFGFIHGANKLLDMWAIIKGRSPTLDLVRWFALVISYVFLFEFGRQIIRTSDVKFPVRWKKIADSFGWWTSPVIIIFILIVSFASLDFWKTGAIWTRYLLGFPGGLLISLGFFSYYRAKKAILEPLNVKKYFFVASLTFLFYGILGGLVVPKGEFFPATWLNVDSFLLTVKIPVQVFRCGFAIFALWSVNGMLTIFNWEITNRLKRSAEEWQETFDAITDIVALISPEHEFIRINKAGCEALGKKPEELIGNKCYEVVHGLDVPIAGCPCAETLRTKKAGTSDITQGGMHFIAMASPIFNKNNELIAFAHTIKDITELVLAKEKEKDAATRAATAEATAKAEKAYAIELETSHKELEKAYAELKQVDKMKSDFMNMAAHELRTPLTPLRGYVEMLKDGMVGELTPKQKEIVNIMRKGIERANHLIGSLLNVSRIDARKMHFAMEPVSIHELVNDVIVSVQPQLADAGHSLTVSVTKDLPLINGDNSMLANVVENLLTNAVKYTPRGGKITIDAMGEDAVVHLMVADTGFGIPKEEQEKIFDKFYQVSKGDKRWAKGVGVGLYVAKYIVEKHNGKIWVESDGGKGSTFHVLLPKMQDEIKKDVAG